MASLNELWAASALIVTCEKLISSGKLSEVDERNLRLLIARCCRAFNVPSIAERPIDDDLTYARMVEAVTREMGA